MNKSLTEFSTHLHGIQEVLENRNDQFVKDLKVAKFDITQENNQMKGSCCDDDLLKNIPMGPDFQNNLNSNAKLF